MKIGRFILVFLTSTQLFFACQNEDHQEMKRPNILLVLTDDQGYGDLSLHGNDSISTPHIDSFAQQNIQFDRFYVSPVCAPTRASLLTGRYHLRTGTSWVTHRKEVMRSEETTIAEVFKSAGYQTGCFGKWHNGEQYPNNPNGQGFDEFYGFTAGHWNNYFDTNLTHNDKSVTSEGYISDVFTNKAIDFIKKNAAKPFLCYVPFNAPHSPFQVPDEYFDKYKKAGLSDKNASVYGMVENIDDNFGRLLQTLREQGIYDNTIIIYLTDNGPNGRRYNGKMRGTKGQVHEGGVRVPCFLSYPKKFTNNQVIEALTAHIDLLPTLAELSDIELPDSLHLDGKSLVPLLNNKAVNWESRPIFTAHTSGELNPFPGAMRTDKYRLIVDHQGKFFLYDMQNDPEQKTDIGADRPRVLTEMKANFNAWFADVTQAGINIPPIPVGYAESPNVHLPAPEAKISGATKFMGKMGWANDYIINWQKENDAATWMTSVQTAGDYTLEIHYTSSEDFIGNTFNIRFGEEKLNVKIKEAYSPSFYPSPDRIERSEVYEKPWKSLNCGKIHAESGILPLSIALKEDATGSFELKGLTLKKE